MNKENREPIDDSRLVRSTLSGDSRSFEILVRKYQKLVYNVIYQMTQNHEATADLSQETFLKAFRALSGFRLQEKFKPWLLKIASNTTINYLRQIKQQNWDSLDNELNENPALEPSSNKDLEKEIEWKFSQQMLMDAMQNLSPRHRQMFILRYQHDLSYTDIANITGQPETTIKSLLFRIREKLRNLLLKKQIQLNGEKHE
ncbi:MAG: sigma-70 family RNA polymerase sigma factor [Candidatus Obscuribacterales bacterium]|nr:sigma-70 family RNA polymerase sigma factor [Candidatus Obscuribacterales bacterium]